MTYILSANKNNINHVYISWLNEMYDCKFLDIILNLIIKKTQFPLFNS